MIDINMIDASFGRLKQNQSIHKVNTSITGEGDQFRVFATVIKIIEAALEKHFPDYTAIHFTSEKDKEESRTSLYTKLAKNAQQNSLKFVQSQNSFINEFILKNFYKLFLN